MHGHNFHGVAGVAMCRRSRKFWGWMLRRLFESNLSCITS